MAVSIFFAKLLGPYCIIIAIGILLNLKTFQKVIEDFCSNSALLYMGGVLALLFGLLVLLFHNVWTANWAVVVTIFGWLGLIKGVWLIVLPNTVAKLAEAYQKNTILLAVNSLIMLALGAALTILGYFVG